jgi:hypothetical protein
MMEDKINAFEMWVYRRIGHISWKEKKTNKAVLEKLGMETRFIDRGEDSTTEILRTYKETRLPAEEHTGG